MKKVKLLIVMTKKISTIVFCCVILFCSVVAMIKAPCLESVIAIVFSVLALIAEAWFGPED